MMCLAAVRPFVSGYCYCFGLHEYFRNNDAGAYGIVVYAYKKGPTTVTFKDSNITASAKKTAGICLGAGENYNSNVGNLTLNSLNSTIITSGPYGLNVSAETQDGNHDASQTVSVTGGSFSSTGGVYVLGDDLDSSTLTFSDVDVTVDIHESQDVAEAIVTGKLNIDSGAYNFVLDTVASQTAFDVVTGNITGGKYNIEPDEDLIAEDYAVSENTGADKVTYPYLVQKLPTVAKIGDNEYTSLKDAVEAAQSGDTITLVADDKVSFSTTGKRILIDKTLTITGAVDENGKPKYTVYGHPTDLTKGMNMIFVKPTASAITFTVSNVAFSEFGNENANTNDQGAIIYVSEGSVNGTSVALNNLEFDKFNRDAIRIYKHTLTVDGCTIDCAKTGDHLTKGIALNNGANATIENTIIKNSGCTYAGWDSAAIESIGGCTATINNCTVVDSENGIIIQGNDAQGTVIIKNANISVSDCAVSASGENIAVSIENGEYTGKMDVRELDSTPGSKLTITGGNFKSDFRADLAKDVEISGGTFDLSENTYCDLDTLASYCKAGYYPFAVENKTDVYIVLPSVTVTFNANGGAETDPVTQNVKKNVATALAENSFTAPTGKQFGSWNTLASPTAENPGTSYADKEEVTLSENLTLYAQWILPPATVETAPKAKTLDYTGSAQALVEAGTATGGTMQYALGTDDQTAPTGGWGTDIPTGKDAKTYYVWYKAVGDANHSDSAPVCLTVTIHLAEPVITGADLVLDASLDFRFYVALPTDFDSTGAHMVFTIRDRNYDIPFVDAKTSADTATQGQKIFSCPVYSIEMAEPVAAVFHYTKGGGDKTTTRTASIKDYLDALDKQSGNTDALKALIDAVRNYGHYIQPYLARLHDFTVGDGGYAEMPAASAGIKPTTVAELDGFKTKWNRYDGTLLESVNYYDTFDTKTFLNVQVKLKSARTLTATVDGAAVEVTDLGGNVYAVRTPGIAANNLGIPARVVFSAGSTVICNIDVSTLTYVRAVLASGRNEADELDALTAFYNYYTAAKDYAG